MNLDIESKLNMLSNFFGISGFILVYVTFCANSAVLCCPGFCLTLCSCTKQKQCSNCTSLHCIPRNSAALHCTALHCTVLCCTALCCAALHYKEINRTTVQSTLSRADKYFNKLRQTNANTRVIIVLTVLSTGNIISFNILLYKPEQKGFALNS